MKKLKYEINIAAPAKKVWETMLAADTYKQWVNVSWPNSYYIGTWKKDAEIKFVGNDLSGTLAKLVEYRPYEYVSAEHIAVLNVGGVPDTESEVAKGWIGTTESYTFTERNGVTELKVEIGLKNPEWEQMFNDGWPNALVALKRLAEGQTVDADAVSQ